MITNYYRRAKFLTSAATINQCPLDEGFEVAFAGRSNAGKSSALNMLVEQKTLARTSKTPGRTQLINFFELDETRRLVDLPGYGYAKVPKAMKQHWGQALEDYLQQRHCLKGVVLLMDIRHPWKEFDEFMLEWAVENNFPLHVLLTKADKFKFGAAKNILLKVQKHIVSYQPLVSCQLFSTLKKQGLEDLQSALNGWFELPTDLIE